MADFRAAEAAFLASWDRVLLTGSVPLDLAWVQAARVHGAMRARMEALWVAREAHHADA